MAIITCASSKEHFDFLSGSTGSLVNFDTDISRYDSSLSRGSMRMPDQGQWLRSFNQTVSEVWVHYVTSFEDTIYDVFNHVMFYDKTTSSEVAGIKCQGNSGNNISFSLWINGIGDLPNTGFTLTTNTLYEIDLHYLPDATNGKVVLYIDKQKQIEYTGNTLPTSGSTTGSSDALMLGAIAYDYNAIHISQVIVADASTVGKKLATIWPESDGTYTEFTNGTAFDIDELTLDSTDFISTDQTNKRYTANYTNIDTTYVGYDIDAVQVTTHARLPASSSINDIQHIVRNNSADHYTANLGITKDGSIYRLESLLLQNPVNNSNWTKSDVDGSEFGVKTV